MGIGGLLPFVRKAWREASLAEFAGATVAVDIYCWIHKGAFACAEALALGKPTDQYVSYCLRLVRLLLRFNLKPVLVFDGKNLPAKADTEEKRRELRDGHRHRAARLLAEGRKAEARECFERCINVTPAMAHNVLQAARALGVDCLVAPYESDAQVACLCKPGGLADLALSEDSDLLAFGCERVFFKLDMASGRGIVIERDVLLAEACTSSGGLSSDRFRHMCILAGCDYHSGVQGVGLITAAKVMAKTRIGDLATLLRKLYMYVRTDAARLSPGEIEALMQAERTFLHQVVFDPFRKCQRPLTPYPPNTLPEDFAFAGCVESDSKRALQYALGNLCFHQNKPLYKEPFEVKASSETSPEPLHLLSIFDPRYRPRPPEQRHYKRGVTEVEQTTPESLSGRQKEVTVSYRPPKRASTSCNTSLVSAAREEPVSEEFISQYYRKNEAEDDENVSSQAEIESAVVPLPTSTSPKSPVFNRSTNNFAVSPDEKPSKRGRFSLDRGMCSPPTPTRDAPARACDNTQTAAGGQQETYLDFLYPGEELKKPAHTSPPVRKPLSPLSPNKEQSEGKTARESCSPKQSILCSSRPSPSFQWSERSLSVGVQFSAKTRVSGLKPSKNKSQRENKNEKFSQNLLQLWGKVDKAKLKLNTD